MTKEQPAHKEHSPLPWKIRSHPDLGSFVESPRQEGKPYGQEILCDDDYPSKEADMELILRAVNNHQQLVDALKEAREFIWATQMVLTLPQVDNDETRANKIVCDIANIKRIDAALSEAERKP